MSRKKETTNEDLARMV